MEGTLKVTPEELIATSTEFSSADSEVSNLTKQMLETIRSIASWIGEANTSYVTKFNTLETEMNKIHAMIDEHVQDLLAMARNYQDAETANMETAQALQSDIF